MPRPTERLRALGLARTSLALGLAVSTGIFFYMSAEGHRGEVMVAIFLELLLIGFVQQGIRRHERVLFKLAAVALGVLALITGSLAEGLVG